MDLLEGYGSSDDSNDDSAEGLCDYSPQQLDAVSSHYSKIPLLNNTPNSAGRFTTFAYAPVAASTDTCRQLQCLATDLWDDLIYRIPQLAASMFLKTYSADPLTLQVEYHISLSYNVELTSSASFESFFAPVKRSFESTSRGGAAYQCRLSGSVRLLSNEDETKFFVALPLNPHSPLCRRLSTVVDVINTASPPGNQAYNAGLLHLSIAEITYTGSSSSPSLRSFGKFLKGYSCEIGTGYSAQILEVSHIIVTDGRRNLSLDL